ncbi:hypothetical protein ABIA38_000795 [Embleya sp. AB8]
MPWSESLFAPFVPNRSELTCPRPVSRRVCECAPRDGRNDYETSRPILAVPHGGNSTPDRGYFNTAAFGVGVGRCAPSPRTLRKFHRLSRTGLTAPPVRWVGSASERADEHRPRCRADHQVAGARVLTVADGNDAQEAVGHFDTVALISAVGGLAPCDGPSHLRSLRSELLGTLPTTALASDSRFATYPRPAVVSPRRLIIGVATACPVRRGSCSPRSSDPLTGRSGTQPQAHIRRRQHVAGDSGHRYGRRNAKHLALVGHGQPGGQHLDHLHHILRTPRVDRSNLTEHRARESPATLAREDDGASGVRYEPKAAVRAAQEEASTTR